MTSHTMDHRLVLAAEEGDVSTVHKILRKPGAVDINYRDNMGNSALLAASRGGYAEVVKLLIEHQCYINIATSLLVRPVHVAAKGDHCDVIKLLLNAGAAIDAKTADGYCPIHYARPNSESYTILQYHVPGTTYEIDDKEELPEVPDHALEGGGKKKKKKAGKGGKKGKKGAKKGGKGSKKKGGKKKKKK